VRRPSPRDRGGGRPRLAEPSGVTSPALVGGYFLEVLVHTTAIFRLDFPESGGGFNEAAKESVGRMFDSPTNADGRSGISSGSWRGECAWRMASSRGLACVIKRRERGGHFVFLNRGLPGFGGSSPARAARCGVAGLACTFRRTPGVRFRCLIGRGIGKVEFDHPVEKLGNQCAILGQRVFVIESLLEKLEELIAESGRNQAPAEQSVEVLSKLVA
jgi:hypothetical protein